MTDAKLERLQRALTVDGVQCSRPGSWGSRTGRHVVHEDGSREFCPTCDCQPLALARVVRRSWWRRLLAWRPWAPATLAPDAWRTDELRREAEYDAAMARWRTNPDGRPAPTMIPSGGVPCAR